MYGYTSVHSGIMIDSCNRDLTELDTSWWLVEDRVEAIMEGQRLPLNGI